MAALLFKKGEGERRKMMQHDVTPFSVVHVAGRVFNCSFYLCYTIIKARRNHISFCEKTYQCLQKCFISDMRIIAHGSITSPIYSYVQEVEQQAVPSPWSLRANVYQFDRRRRLASFNGFQESYHTKEEFADNGFRWLGVDSDVCCCFCRCILGDFEPEDDIVEVHALASPHCPMVKKKKERKEGEEGQSFFLF